MVGGTLTTNVLDTARGRPAAGLRIDLAVIGPDGRPRRVKTMTTDADGRTETPLLAAGELQPGRYELTFHVGAYFKAVGAAELDGITEHLQRRRHLGQRPPVRAAKPKLAVGLSIELVALLVNGAVVAGTEQGEIRERGGAPLGPVTEVMALAEPAPAAWEPAAVVAVVERPP